MESGLQRLFLIVALAFCANVHAQSESNEEDDRSILDAVINPDIERRKIDERRIDSENFEFGFYAGTMSIEDFGTNNSYGLNLNFHVSEDWFLELAYGISEAAETSFETLSPGVSLIAEDDRELQYYSLSLGLNVVQGEVFAGKRRAYNAAIYTIVGAGNTLFADDEFFTLNFGAGIKFFTTDWISARMGVRNHLFSHSIFGVEKSIQNIEYTFGLSLYF